MRLALGTDREPKRVLPLGLALSLWLKKSMLFGAVLIAVATIILASSIREEGLKGMSPNSDQNSFARLGIIVMLFGLTFFASGVHEAFTTYELLKSGIIGAAFVTHCKEVTSGATYELNGFRWKSKPKSKEILLADYQRQVSEKHRSQYNVSYITSDELPSLFRKRACILEFNATNFIEPIRLEMELDLKGDASDALPHPILYLRKKPTKAKLLNALELRYSVGPNGEHVLHADSALPHALALLLIVLSAIVGVVVVTLF